MDHPAEDGEGSGLFRGRKHFQHPDFHGSDGGTGFREPFAAQRRELGGKNFTHTGLRCPAHESITFQGLQQHVHGLAGDKGAPGEFGVGEPGR